MIKNISRDYEVSIWTLQDSFIAILKQSNLENKGTIQDPQITLKDDGDNTFSFKIPMYIRENTGVTEPFFKDGNVWRENPIWYTVRNGNLIANLRKIKVIFDKGGENEKVFEYIINNVKEEHEGYSKYCEVECGGLAFHELGKQGYEIELSQAIYDKDVQDWKENPTDTMPINNINYWIEKVLAGSNWIYDINMDWSLYDGIIGPRASNDGVRQPTKVYDQPYISNWTLNETNSELVANSIVTGIDKLEKRRIVEKSESNRYNLLMTIAETFQVFCRFEYEHDDNYHITNRKVIFYNNFVKEAEKYIDLNYGYNVSKITREMDSTDLISKMYVSTLTGTGTLTNEVNLKDVDANLSLENYLFNFEYLYKIGTISQEQYEAVRELEVKLRGKNIKYIENSKQLAQLESEKIDLEAKIKFADDVIEQASLNINDASNISSKLESISEYTTTNPLSRAVIHNYANPLLPYITIPRQLGGIIASGLTIYTEVDNNGTVKTDKPLEKFTIDRDEYNFIKQINFPVAEETEIPTYLYLVCKFEPKTPAKIIQEIWQGKQAQAKQDRDVAAKRLGKEDELEIDDPNDTTVYQDINKFTKENDTILEEKRKLIESFERLMGPAIREGTWQPEDSYANYHTDENFTVTLENNSTDSEAAVGFTWDTELFNGELNNSYKFGVTDTRFYPAIFLDNDNINISDLNNLNFIYQDIYFGDTDPTNESKKNHYLYYGADNGCKFAFLKNKNNEEIRPALLLLGAETMDEIVINNDSHSILSQLNNNNRLANISYDDSNISVFIEANKIEDLTVEETSGYEIVYPRFFINADKYITTLPETKIYYDGEALKEFTDYKAPQYRDGKFYLTLNIDLSNYKNSLENYKFNYFQSSAGEAMYLDAVEVLRENSVPKVSYTVEPAALDKNFMLTAYNRLGQLAHINDQELKFENVRGYFSEMNLNLDKPWEDNYTIKNYKTKFEDLFSTIVAQTEAMQKNSQLFSAVSNAFNTGGWLTDAMVGNIKDRLDFSIPTPEDIYRQYEPAIRDMLTESFNEAGEVLAAAQSSVNDVNNLNITNAGILGSFVENIKENMTPATFTYFPRESITFKVGDIWSFTNEGIAYEYLATKNSSQIDYNQREDKTKSLKGWSLVKDGSLAQIKGASLDVNTESGKIQLLAENEINIGTSGLLKLAGNNVKITGNEDIQIGGPDVYIYSASKKDDTETNPNHGIHVYASELGSGTSTVDITGQGIEMAAANGIKFKSGGGIDFSASDGTNTSAVRINKDEGIYLGSNNPLKLYSGPVDSNGSGASVELSTSRILFGVSNSSNGTAIEITDNYFIIGAANIVQSGTTNSSGTGTKDMIGSSTGAAGVKITKTSIQLATGDYNTTASQNTRNYISMDSNGIELANSKNKNNGAIVKIDQNGVIIGTAPSAGNISQHITNIKNGSDTMVNYHGAKFQVYAPNFVVDANGYLYAYGATIAGTITATSGKIGGWSINADGQLIYSETKDDNYKYTVALSPLGKWEKGTTDSWAFIAQKSKTGETTLYSGFTWSGELHSNAAYIKGEITATSGSIGGWTLGSSALYLNSSTPGDSASTLILSKGTKSTSSIGGSPANTEKTWMISAGQKFGVTTTGDLFANSANITGVITANSGRIGGTSGWYIDSGYIGNASTLANSTVGMYQSTNSNDIVFWAGNKTRTSAPFRVTAGGAVTANSITIGSGDNTLTYTSSNGLNVTGKITATSLTVGSTTGDSYLTYDSTNGLKVKGAITATSLTVGDSNTMTYDSSNGLKIGGNTSYLKYDNSGLVVNGAINATGGSLSNLSLTGPLTITDGSIKYSTTEGNFFNLNTAGITGMQIKTVDDKGYTIFNCYSPSRGLLPTNAEYNYVRLSRYSSGGSELQSISFRRDGAGNDTLKLYSDNIISLRAFKKEIDLESKNINLTADGGEGTINMYGNKVILEGITYINDNHFYAQTAGGLKYRIYISNTAPSDSNLDEIFSDSVERVLWIDVSEAATGDWVDVETKLKRKASCPVRWYAKK